MRDSIREKVGIRVRIRISMDLVSSACAGCKREVSAVCCVGQHEALSLEVAQEEEMLLVERGAGQRPPALAQRLVHGPRLPECPHGDVKLT